MLGLAIMPNPPQASPVQKKTPFSWMEARFYLPVREIGQNPGRRLAPTIQKQQQPTAVVKLLLITLITRILKHVPGGLPLSMLTLHGELPDAMQDSQWGQGK